MLGQLHNNQQYPRRSISGIKQQVQQTERMLRLRNVPQEQSELDFTRRSINRIQQHVQQTEGMARFIKVPQEQSELDSVSNSQQMLWRPICQESATNIPVERNQQDNSANDVCEEIRECIVEQLD